MERNARTPGEFMARLLITLALASAAFGAAGPVAARSASRSPWHLTSPQAHAGPYATTPAARQLMARGYLVTDPAAHGRLGAQTAAAGSAAGPAKGTAPSLLHNWKGQNDTSVTPGDSTGAVGTTRYVEMVNDRYGIYGRDATTKSSGTLATLTGDSTGSLTDPQVIWDPGTNRFYYVVLDFSSNVFEVGFSKTATPTSSSDFCKYSANYGYGSSTPDFPKLGDTADFWLIGVNVFSSGGSYLRSDVDWITKPPAGSTCPSGSTFHTGLKSTLLNADGTKAFTPVPANQTDTASQGWIVAAKDVGAGSASTLTVFSVSKNNDGSANIQGTGSSVTVSSYRAPPPAPQAHTSVKLDTSDARLTQAVSATDPARGGAAVWTQHTVAGGAGSEVRWYEINAASHVLYQSGKATSTSLYVFDGAIAPDRAVNGSSKAFGNSMALLFNTSSATADVAIKVVSKIGSGTQSGFVLVKQSAGPNVDFSCTPVCRWGDYSGASPDPAADPAGAHGDVWGTATWNVSSVNNSDVDWRTQNTEIAP